MLHELYGTDGLDSMNAERVFVDACLAGNESAWESMVRSYNKCIFNICLRFIGNREEAEDLTQEIFVRIYRSMKSFRADSGSFQGWILRVARNLAIDYYRKMRRSQSLIGSEEMELLHLEDHTTPDPAAALEQSEACRSLIQVLLVLNPDLRKALILRDLHGMSYQQVAKITGVSEGTAKSRVFRARLHLAQAHGSTQPAARRSR
jgi:RNA polymerase sigma-70 factor, ECF subfamily